MTHLLSTQAMSALKNVLDNPHVYSKYLFQAIPVQNLLLFCGGYGTTWSILKILLNKVKVFLNRNTQNANAFCRYQ